MNNPIEVIFKRMPSDSRDFIDEPQYIKIMPNNTNIIAVISDDRINGDPYDFTVTFDGLPRHYDKIAVNYVLLKYSIPNINIRNNQLIFNSTITGNTHTGYITPGFYNFNTIGSAIKNALDNAVPAHGLTFTATQSIAQQNYTISVSAGLFSFQDCTMRSRGIYTMKLPAVGILSASHIINGLTLHYTRSIWVYSDELNRYNKNPNYSSNKFNSQFLLVFTINDPTVPIFYAGAYNVPANYIKYEKSHAISAVDVKIIDDFGENPKSYLIIDPNETNDYISFDIGGVS